MKILLADDHALVRAGIKALLDRYADLQVVAEAGEGRAALALAEAHHPDVILLDVSMPGLNGLEALERLRQAAPQARVIVLSMHNVEEYVARAMKAGATSYLLKDTPEEDLIQAVRAAGRGESYLCPPLTAEVVEQYLEKLGPGAAPLERLTPREREVLQLLAEGRSTQEIGQTLSISPKTVETHRANLMDKLQLYDIASLTRFAVRAGLVA